MLMLGFFTKGFTALFPLSLPFFYWLFVRSKKFGQMALDTLVVLAGLVVSAAILLGVSDAAYENTLLYLDGQVVHSLKNVQTVPYRLYCVRRLFNESIPHFIVILLIFIVCRKTHNTFIAGKKQLSMFGLFLCLGLSGVLPIAVSLKQGGYYIIAALPFFAVAWALLLDYAIENWIGRISAKLHKFFLWASGVILMAGIIFTVAHIGAISREKDLLHDLHRILPQISEHTIITGPHDWTLHAYCARYKYVSIDTSSTERKYMLLRDTTPASQFSKNYKLLKLGTKQWYLYEEQ
jgi:hypothetical protein